MLSHCQQTTSKSCGCPFNWLLLMGRFLSHIRFVVLSFFSCMNIILLVLLIEKFVWLQAFLKLRHETKVEHIFVVGNSGKFEIVLVKFFSFKFYFYFIEGRFKWSQAISYKIHLHHTFTVVQISTQSLVYSAI